jgi:DnaA-homolog protein
LLGQCRAMQRDGQQVAYLPCLDHAALHPAMLEGLAQLDLIAIDDVDAIAGQADWEHALFVLFNQARDNGCRLLFAAAQPPAECSIVLPDLRSRLAWGPVAAIATLDDAARERLIHQLAQQRGLEMPEEIARYLVQRYRRDNHSLQQLIERLDRDSLAEQRRLSIPFVRARMQD